MGRGDAPRSPQTTESIKTGTMRSALRNSQGQGPVGIDAAPCSRPSAAPTMNTPFQSFTLNLGPISPPASSQQDQEQIQTLLQSGRWSELEQAARALTHRNPSSALAWKALGLSLHRQGKLDDALQPSQQAAKLAPQDPEAFNNLGALLSEGEHLQHAEACFRRALQLQGHHIPSLENLITLLGRQGRHEEVRPLLEHYLRLDPDNEYARHQLAMLSGEQTEAAPAGYVRQVFDEYAERFDSHLLGKLGYRTPEHLAKWLLTEMPSQPKWKVLDLGCGTGLVGEHIHTRCEELVGIDLSGRMLDKARERGGYTRLEHEDVLAQMQRETDHHFDVIVSADVFVYIGKLDELMGQARRILKPGGLLVFSVESLDAAQSALTEEEIQRGYRLESTGRYTHARAHLIDLAATHGFTVVRQEEVKLREEGHRPVTGQLHLWRG